MTLEEAIAHCQEVVDTCENNECVLDHKQLIEWLQELQQLHADKEQISDEQQKETPAYTYEQLATLNIQLEGIVAEMRTQNASLRAQNQYYVNILSNIMSLIKPVE